MTAYQIIGSVTIYTKHTTTDGSDFIDTRINRLILARPLVRLHVFSIQSSSAYSCFNVDCRSLNI